jgi:hypothetical protein
MALTAAQVCLASGKKKKVAKQEKHEEQRDSW